MPEQQITLSIAITQELKDLVREWAKEDDRSVSYIIRQLLEQEAKRRSQKEETNGNH